MLDVLDLEEQDDERENNKDGAVSNLLPVPVGLLEGLDDHGRSRGTDTDLEGGRGQGK